MTKFGYVDVVVLGVCLTLVVIAGYVFFPIIHSGFDTVVRHIPVNCNSLAWVPTAMES